MGRDLGPYHVRAEFANARGFAREWGMCSDEADMIRSIVWLYADGDWSCDCNRKHFIAEAYCEPDPKVPCGDTLQLTRLTLIRPDGTEKVIYEAEADES